MIHLAVRDLVAPGARVEAVHRFRSSPLPFPAKLVLTTAQRSVACVVKTSTETGQLQHEANVLSALKDLSFAAPRVMAGPLLIPTGIGSIETLVMSVVPGDALPWIGVTDVATADRTCQAVFDAIDQLHALTPRVAAHPIAANLPVRTLDAELETIAQRQSPWTETQISRGTLQVLQRQIPRHRRPLVFSNGDYNPLNVLSTDSGVTSWVDFEFGCLEDPLIGLPKFLFWREDRGWSLGAQTGLVQRFLYRHNVPLSAFMVRVALRGLTHLHDTTPNDPPTVMLEEIDRAVTVLSQDD